MARRVNGFILFMQDEINKCVNTHPREIKIAWDNLSVDQKNVYQKRALDQNKKKIKTVSRTLSPGTIEIDSRGEDPIVISSSLLSAPVPEKKFEEYEYAVEYCRSIITDDLVGDLYIKMNVEDGHYGCAFELLIGKKLDGVNNIYLSGFGVQGTYNDYVGTIEENLLKKIHLYCDECDIYLKLSDTNEKVVDEHLH